METISRCFLSFLIYSFLGWVCECIYCSILDKKFTNRGFLSGPLCPVYGFGALLVIVVLNPLKDRWPLLFLGGFLLTSVVEYITSFLLEKLFHMAWWDYSNYKFNLNGRVCLLNSTLFGVLTVIVVKGIAPFVDRLVSGLSPSAVQWIAFFAWCVLECDTILSVHSVLALNGKLEMLAQIKLEIRSKSDEVRRLVRNKLTEQSKKRSDTETRLRLEIELLTARLHSLEESARFPTRRLIEAFPGLRSVRESEAIHRIRTAIQKKRDRLRAERKSK